MKEEKIKVGDDIITVIERGGISKHAKGYFELDKLVRMGLLQSKMIKTEKGMQKVWWPTDSQTTFERDGSS